MPLFHPISLGGAVPDEIPQRIVRAKSQPVSRYNAAPAAAKTKASTSNHRALPQRKPKIHDPESCREGVDAHDLSRRLYGVLAKQGQLGTYAPRNTAALPPAPAETKRLSMPVPDPAHAAVPASKPAGPYVPSEAAAQFKSTTAAMGMPRNTIHLKPRPSNMALSGPLGETREAKETKRSRPLQKRPSVSPSTSLRHAFQDAQEPPGCKRLSMKGGVELASEPSDDSSRTSEQRNDSAYGGDLDHDTDGALAAGSTTKSSKAAPPAEYIRIAQEHTVDWTQSDELRELHELRQLREQHETAKRAEMHKQEAENKLAEEREAEKKEAEMKKNRLHRLRARLSTFSCERLASEDVPALASPTASSPPSSTGLSLTTSATMAAQPLGQPASKLAGRRSFDRFRSIFKH